MPQVPVDHTIRSTHGILWRQNNSATFYHNILYEKRISGPEHNYNISTGWIESTRTVRKHGCYAISQEEVIPCRSGNSNSSSSLHVSRCQYYCSGARASCLRVERVGRDAERGVHLGLSSPARMHLSSYGCVSVRMRGKCGDKVTWRAKRDCKQSCVGIFVLISIRSRLCFPCAVMPHPL